MKLCTKCLNRTNSHLINFKVFRSFWNYPCPRKLREIVKLSMFDKETPEIVKEIWNHYHSQKNRVISDAVDKDAMDIIINK